MLLTWRKKSSFECIILRHNWSGLNGGWGHLFLFLRMLYHYDYYNNEKFIKYKLWAVVISLSVCLFICLCFFLFVSVFVSLFVSVCCYMCVYCWYICLFISLFFLSIYLSVCLSSVACNFASWWSVFLCICTSQFVCLSSHLSNNAPFSVSVPARYCVCPSYSIKSALHFWESLILFSQMSNLVSWSPKTSLPKIKGKAWRWRTWWGVTTFNNHDSECK